MPYNSSNAGYIKALEKVYIAALEKQVRDLRAALEPFASAAQFADENPLAAFEGIVCDADVLRAARAALADTMHESVKTESTCSPAEAKAYMDMLIRHGATLVREWSDDDHDWVWFVTASGSYDERYSDREQYARAKDPYMALQLARVVLDKQVE